MSATGYVIDRCDQCGREKRREAGKAQSWPNLSIDIRRRGGREPVLAVVLTKNADLCSAACARLWLDVMAAEAMSNLAPPKPSLNAPDDAKPVQ